MNEPPPKPLPEPLPQPLPEPEAQTPNAALGAQVRTAAKWSLLNTILIRVGTFAAGVVLARGLLSPREWGVYATCGVILSVLLSANEMGVSLALIRWPQDVREFAPTVLTLSAGFSAVLYAVLYFCAPEFARALGSPDATKVLRVLCISVLIDGVACVPASVLTRTFAQGRRLFIDFANFTVSTGVTLAFAFHGAGAMSFAWGGVAGNSCAMAGCAMAAPGFLRPGWNRAQARALLQFGAPLAAASLFVLAMINTDSVVIAVTLGPASLGLYQIAFNMSSWPVRTVSEAARRVSFAGFSRAATSDRELADGFHRGLSPLLTAAVPGCALLAALPGPLIDAVYGPQWFPGAQALRYLAILGLLRIAYELCYDFLVAAGKRRTLLAVQGWWLLALIPTLIVGARLDGIAGVGAGHIMVAGGLVAPAFLYALRSAGVPLLGVLQVSVRPLAGGVLVVAVATAVHGAAGNSDLALAVSCLVALIAYVPVAVPTPRLLRIYRARRPAGLPT